MSEEHSTEIWQDIPGHPGYQASSLGRVRSFFKRGRHLAKFRDEPIVLRQHALPKGYLIVNLREGGRTVHHYVHRLVLLAFRGPPPEGMESRHVDNNDPADCRLENLCWGTRSQNVEDRRRHGTLQCGSRNGQARLTEAKVILMRLLGNAGMVSRDIASLFQQNYEHVRRILRRELWTHV